MLGKVVCLNINFIPKCFVVAFEIFSFSTLLRASNHISWLSKRRFCTFVTKIANDENYGELNSHSLSINIGKSGHFSIFRFVSHVKRPKSFLTSQFLGQGRFCPLLNGKISEL